MDTRTYRRGEVIFREGEESDVAYLIEQGRVEIYTRMDGGTLLLGSLGEHEIFGEMGILCDTPRSATAAAETDLVLRILTRESIASILHTQPAEVVTVIKALMERLREVNQKLSRMASKQAQFQLSTGTPPPIQRVTLLPLTSALKAHMPAGGLVLSALPFRVGGLPAGTPQDPLDWNDLFLPVPEGSDILSRNHFSIQRGQNGLSISDRGSRYGTIVNGQPLHATNAEAFRADLHPGDNEIIAGPEDSPYRFCVVWE